MEKNKDQKHIIIDQKEDKMYHVPNIAEGHQNHQQHQNHLNDQNHQNYHQTVMMKKKVHTRLLNAYTPKIEPNFTYICTHTLHTQIST